MEQVKGQQPIAILMATYNGERYISEQLDSIMRQSCTSWQLFVHDDGSTDQTPAILRSYALEHDNMTVLEYESQRGSAANFLSLLQRVEADYYMFSDQDDVWRNDKIQVSFDAMQNEETAHPGKPVIVYSDLCVTDKALKVVCESFWQQSNIHPEFLTKFADIAAVTPATGSTMLFNRQARQQAVYPANHATMHDAWVTACVLRTDGIIHPISQPLVSYRQHEDNVIGAASANRITLAYRLRNAKKMLAQNKRHYAMLRSLGYGSVIKYIIYKIYYKIRIHRQSKR